LLRKTRCGASGQRTANRVSNTVSFSLAFKSSR
jgi:hypothetical protein